MDAWARPRMKPLWRLCYVQLWPDLAIHRRHHCLHLEIKKVFKQLCFLVAHPSFSAICPRTLETQIGIESICRLWSARGLIGQGTGRAKMFDVTGWFLLGHDVVFVAISPRRFKGD